MKKLTAVILTLASLPTLMMGCTKSPEDELLGLWYEVGGGETMQFFEDGTVVIASAMDFTGEYRVLEDDHIRFDLSGVGALAGPIVVSYELDGDSLVIIETDGDRSTYSREATGASQSAGSTGHSSSAASIREQVTEGLYLSGGAKAAVSEFYFDQGRWPETNGESGLAEADDIQGAYVGSVTVENGVITVHFGGTHSEAHDEIRGKDLLLTPTATDGSISWACSSPSIAPEYLPAACR